MPSTLAVRFYATSRGNCFMAELAAMFVEGFGRLGIEASLELDVVPPTAADEIHVLVAPHEFFPLFLQKELDRRSWQAIADGSWCLATEQPGSRHYEKGFPLAARSRGVFDINRQGVHEFQVRGVHAVYVPLGYTPSLERPGSDARDIDVLFLGHHSTKRARFLARHADVLARYRCHLVLSDVDRPRLATTPGFYSGEARDELLRRSRVLLNVHSTDRRYFEWLRAIPAMANGCLVVSEESDGAEPLADGEHLVMAGLEELMDRCEEHIRDEEKRRATAERALRFLRTELPIETGCRQILAAELECRERRGREAETSFVRRSAQRLQRMGRAGLARVRSKVFSIKSLPAAFGPFLRRQPLAHRIFYPARSLFDRLRGQWSLAETEERRRAIIERMEESERRQAEGQSPDYGLLPNARYGAANPAVSVVITLYNYARYIEECVESVARSQCDGLDGGIEAVVVDDASTDDSAEVARRILQRSPLPACLVGKRSNTGLAAARNLGVRLARAPRVFVLDADNRIYPRCLARLASTLRDARAAAAYSPIRKFDGRTGQSLDLFSCFAWDVRRLVWSPYIDAMAMFDREKLLAVGGYSTELIRYGWFGWEDYDLWLKLAQADCPVAFCPEILSEYRVHGSSMIQATLHYKPRLVRYFQEKFADLAERYPAQPRQFGWATGRKK